MSIPAVAHSFPATIDKDCGITVMIPDSAHAPGSFQTPGKQFVVWAYPADSGSDYVGDNHASVTLSESQLTHVFRTLIDGVSADFGSCGPSVIVSVYGETVTIFTEDECAVAKMELTKDQVVSLIMLWKALDAAMHIDQSIGLVYSSLLPYLIVRFKIHFGSFAPRKKFLSFIRESLALIGFPSQDVAGDLCDHFRYLPKDQSVFVQSLWGDLAALLISRVDSSVLI
jgi:hypothetical protein